MAKRSRSVLKRQRKDARARQRNASVKSKLRTLVKAARSAARSGDESVSARVASAMRALDKAAARGIIHRNAASRRKKRLIRFVRTYAPQSST